MLNINDILSISSGAEFEKAALELFAFQAEHCKPYSEYIVGIGIDPRDVRSTDDIPFLPIEIFKSRKVYSLAAEPGIVFTSSTTGGGEPSRHYMRSVTDYEAAFRAAFRAFYGNPSDWGVYALLPGYLERQGSSLIYMANDLIKTGHGGFYLDDHELLLSDMSRDTGPKILLGVSHALLDLAERHAPDMAGTVVMETGGMKGKRDEIPKDEFHAILCKAFNVPTIHSEYGMAELTSQAYSKGNGLFSTTPWMRIAVRDLNDPFEILPAGRAGGINIIDLANISSCAFIQTQDIGILRDRDSCGKEFSHIEKEGGFTAGGDIQCIDRPSSHFSILGRVDHSEIRGCNLLVQ